MLDQLLNYIQIQKLFQPEDKVILAVSGGIDSMAMVHLFQRTDFRYAIAHCNFQLRGAESDNDQALVEGIATQYRVPVYVRTFHTREYAKKHGISIQMAARALRQAWFDEMLKSEGYDWIATAHQLNDSIETAIFNLAKGTGISGLRGILPKSNRYIRPLMFASRDMIANYVQEHGILWNEDSSNKSIKYHRNLIRHKILPELKKINPNLEETFSISMEKIAAAERIYLAKISEEKQLLTEQTGNGYRLDKLKIASLPESLTVLYEILQEYGFNFHLVKDIFSKMHGQPGKTFYSGHYQLLVDRQYLYLSVMPDGAQVEVTIEAETREISLQYGQLTFQLLNVGDVKFTGDQNIAFFDFDQLKFPLTVRLWRQGDRFRPLGMQHKKKLSDFMIDEKIPLNLKQQVHVLLSGGEVVWVIGHRIDDRYKITGQTRKTLMVCNKSLDDKSV